MHQVMPSDHIIHACYLITVFMDLMILFMSNRIYGTQCDPSWRPKRPSNFQRRVGRSMCIRVFVPCVCTRTEATFVTYLEAQYVMISNDFLKDMNVDPLP